jgi:hypothetical protein
MHYYYRLLSSNGTNITGYGTLAESRQYCENQLLETTDTIICPTPDDIKSALILKEVLGEKIT